MSFFSSRKIDGRNGALPAIWSAFAQQAAWKDWVMAALLILNALTILVSARLAARDPDVVIVSPDGKSSYLPRSMASAALLDFIADQKQQPSDVTVVHFTKDFVRLALSANSTTIDATWAEALAMMGEKLRVRLSEESEAKRLLVSIRVLRVKSTVSIDDIVLTERTKDLLQVKATVHRTKSGLLDESRAAVEEHLEIDLVERIVPRTVLRPDGIEVVDWRFVPQSGPSAGASVTHAH